MRSSAWFSCDAGTACTNTYRGSAALERAVQIFRPAAKKLICALMPAHSKERLVGPETTSSYAASSGEGQSSHLDRSRS